MPCVRHHKDLLSSGMLDSEVTLNNPISMGHANFQVKVGVTWIQDLKSSISFLEDFQLTH